MPPSNSSGYTDVADAVAESGIGNSNNDGGTNSSPGSDENNNNNNILEDLVGDIGEMFAPDNVMATENPHYSVLYDAEDHWSVLTQLYGSLWPRVLPYCVANVVLMVVLRIVKDKFFPSLEISTQGHSFVSVVVAFLLVSRVQSCQARYADARNSLATMYRATRELIMDVSILTLDNTSDNAKRWRYEVAYRALLLLRTSMAVIDYPTDFIASWKVPELQGEELEDIMKHSFYQNGGDMKAFRHEARSEFEESMRVPIRISYLLKKSIQKHSKMLLIEEHSTGTSKTVAGAGGPIATSHYVNLLKNVDEFMNGYYGMRKMLTTPIPFPLVQMARTFLFAYVFTIPFAFLSDKSPLVAHCFEVFLLTYGFVGLELVAIELDNPFGDDENDFDNLALAKSCMEDVYLIMYDTDGYESAMNLRKKMSSIPGQKTKSTDKKKYQFSGSMSNLDFNSGNQSVTGSGSASYSSLLSSENSPLMA